MAVRRLRVSPSRAGLLSVRQGAAALCLVLTWSGAAQAQLTEDIGPASGILPATGFGNSLPSMRDFLNPPQKTNGSPGLDFAASLAASLGYTGGSGDVGQQTGFQGRLQPSLSVTGSTRLATVNLAYNPTLYYYPSSQPATRIAENFNGLVHAELYPETFFVDLRGYATETSNSNLYSPTGSTQALNRQDQSQVYTASISPYLVHTFGTFGTAVARYSLNDTTQLNSVNELSTTAPVGQNIQTITQSEDLNFTTGTDFDRFHNTVDISGSQFGGSATAQGGHRDLASYELGYAINRFVTVLAKAGYEDLYYSATRSSGVLTSAPYKVNGPIGGVGLKLTPNPDSSIAISYGYLDGGPSIELDATYKPTARTSLFATSSSGVTTNSQLISGFVNDSDISDSGIAIDPNTGAPLQFGNTLFGGLTQPYRLTRTSVTGSLEWDRDIFTANIIAQQRQNPGGMVINNVAGSSVFGSISWQHQTSDTLSGNLSVHYGVQTNSGNSTTVSSSSNTLSFNASATKIINEKLSGSFTYSFLSRDSNVSSQRATINELLLGLMQRF